MCLVEVKLRGGRKGSFGTKIEEVAEKDKRGGKAKESCGLTDEKDVCLIFLPRHDQGLYTDCSGYLEESEEIPNCIHTQ